MTDVSRHLVVLFDGTGHSLGRGKRKNHSNIFLLADAINSDVVKNENIYSSQIVFYFSGPGTRSKIGQKTEMVLGSELESIIKEAYVSLCLHYNPARQDKIYIFGYSRGAAAAKVLCDLINKVGLLEKEYISRLDKVWDFVIFEDVEKQAYLVRCTYKVDVDLIGLFDPVFGPDNSLMYLSSSDELPENIIKAVEILSLDERRISFKHKQWHGSRKDIGADPVARPLGSAPTRLDQIWLPGGHGNVGQPSEGSFVAEVAFLTMIDYIMSHTSLSLKDRSISDAVNSILSAKSFNIQKKGDFILYREARKVERNRFVKLHYLVKMIINKKILINGKVKHYNPNSLSDPISDYEFYEPINLSKYGYNKDCISRRIEDFLAEL